MTDNDYAAINPQIVFEPSTPLRRSVPINIIADGFFEDLETFSLIIDPIQTDSAVTVGFPDSATILIQDLDGTKF